MPWSKAYTVTDLNSQLGPKKVAPLEIMEQKWRALSLPQEKFDDLVRIGSFGGETEWLKLFALAASSLNEVNHFPLVLKEDVLNVTELHVFDRT